MLAAAGPTFRLLRSTLLAPRHARGNALLRFTVGGELHPGLDVEVVLMDFAVRIEREEVVLRCANLYEPRHHSFPSPQQWSARQRPHWPAPHPGPLPGWGEGSGGETRLAFSRRG